MRITNTMMMNQTLRNVGKSKTNLNTTENQMSTEKKITRPSDDPIVAIRALSLRSSLSEINQYLKHNIPDAESWLDVTESSLNNMDSIFTDIYQYANQGASDQFTVNDRSAIIDVLKQYKDSIYSEANTDYAGRYCFTGYKTDSSFTFLTSEDANKNYEITQEFTADDVSTMNIMKNAVDTSTVTNISAADTPETESVYRLRLAYEGCSSTLLSGASLDVTATDGTVTSYAPTAISEQDFETLCSTGAFDAMTNSVYYIYDTGNLAFTKDLYSDFSNCESMSFSYEKDGFEKGDPRPEMYFNCKDVTDTANPIDYTIDPTGQAISYTINFSQSLQVNTLGKDALSYNIGRDIDDMCNALQMVSDCETKISKLKEMQESSAYTTAQKEDIATMLEAANKEHDYALENMESLFSNEISKVKEYQQTIDLELADLGARSTRLSLAKSRLTEQYTTFDDLKSKNEDVDLEDAVIEYSSAQTLYKAALTAASDCVQQSLLDYI